LTGRPGGGCPYFDSDLSVPSCRNCNLVNEHAWSASGLLVVREPWFVVRAKRLAFGASRLDDVSWTGPVHDRFWKALNAFALDAVAEYEAVR